MKRLLDENGKSLKVAGPGTAAEIIGWRDLPHPGDKILEVESEVSGQQISINFYTMMKGFFGIPYPNLKNRV